MAFLSCAKNISALFAKVIKRFFRLLFPIVGACVYIYIIYKVVGFHNAETKFLFTNVWYQNGYSNKFLWTDIFLDPVCTVLKGGSKFNSPYWCIRGMFVSSIIIIVCNFLKNRFIKLKHLFAALIIGWCVAGGNTIQQACICGMLSQWYEEEFRKIIYNKKIAGIVLGLCALLMMLRVRLDLGMIYFSVIVLIIPQFVCLKKVLTSKIFLKLGSISFGIYSFHWPLLCSVGALLQLHLFGIFPTDLVMLLVFSVTGIITILLSFLYHITLEEVSCWGVNKISTVLGKMLYSD